MCVRDVCLCLCVSEVSVLLIANIMDHHLTKSSTKKALHKDFLALKGGPFRCPLSVCHMSVWFDKYETRTNLMLSEVALQNLSG